MQAPRKLLPFWEEKRAKAVHGVLLKLSLETEPVVCAQIDASIRHRSGIEAGVVQSPIAMEFAEFERSAEERLAVRVENPVSMRQLAQSLSLVLLPAAQSQSSREVLVEVRGKTGFDVVVERKGVLLVLLWRRDAGEVGEVLDRLARFVEVLEMGLSGMQSQGQRLAACLLPAELDHELGLLGLGLFEGCCDLVAGRLRLRHTLPQQRISLPQQRISLPQQRISQRTVALNHFGTIERAVAAGALPD